MPAELFKTYYLELTNICASVSPREFEQFVQKLDDAFERDKKIYIFGNSGSGANAAHFACDLNKGVSYGKEKRFKVICLNDNLPIIAAYANDISYDEVFVEQLKNFLEPGDLVIGVSGSGNSENVLKGIQYANQSGGKTIGICGYGGGKLKNTAQSSIVINSFDMQKVEDLQSIIFHCTMQWFMKKKD